MTTAVMATTSEPLGIVIRNGADTIRPPRILVWLWANEEDANDAEEWRER